MKSFLAIFLCVVMALSLAPTVFADSKIPVTSITITGAQTPVIGQKCTVDTVHMSTVPACAAEFTPYWYDLTDGRKIPQGTEFRETDVFIEGHEYSLYAWIAPSDGYTFLFDSDKNYTGTATIDGKAPSYAKEIGGVGWLMLSSDERITPVKGTPITSVAITGVQTPVIGQKCTVETVKITTVPANSAEFTPYWYDLTDGRKIPQGTEFREMDVFTEGHEYALYAWIAPLGGYTFPFDSDKNYTGTVTIDGKAPSYAKEIGGVGWLMLTSDERIKPVKYAPKTFNLTTSVIGGHGNISAGKSGLAENTEETVIFTPDSGYETDKVTVNGVETGVLSNVLTVTMDGDKAVSVTYKKTGVPSETEDTAPSEEASGTVSDKEPSATVSDKEPSATVSDKEPSATVSDKEPSATVSGKEPSATFSDKEPSATFSGKETKEAADSNVSSEKGRKELSAWIIITIIGLLCLIAVATVIIITKKKTDKE